MTEVFRPSCQISACSARATPSIPVFYRALLSVVDVAMLATNGYITGQMINVNGGWCMT